ncbi:MAG: MFS transporter [Proteobacteria bacterium]|nr:MFS transporter [Burkholderiales bacterium]
MMGREARWWFVPPDTGTDLPKLLAMRTVRAFGDGYVSLLLPVYLLALGFSPVAVGAIATATLLGSGAMVFGLGLFAHRFSQRQLVLGAAVLMTVSGFAFSLTGAFWPLFVIALVGTLNPTTGDVTVFSPLEQAMVTQTVAARDRTAVFARYSLLGSLAGAAGSLFAAVPEWIDAQTQVGLITALQAMFAIYGVFGVLTFFVYRTLTGSVEPPGHAPNAPLVESRPIVMRLAAVFSLDAFGGGFAVQSLVALWLFQRFDLSIATAGQIFFWAGLFAAGSYLLSSWVARRIGLINTMVFTHLPANVFLILAPLMPTLELAVTMLLLRYAMSSMDIPARTSFVMAVVPAHERAAAASFTAVPRSLAAGISPFAAGWLLSVSSFGWPLVIAGTIKIGYDLLLLRMFRSVKPPEER